MLTRRDFLTAAAAAAAVPLRAAETDREDFAGKAIGLAKKAGAAYADIRINRYDSENIFTRERQVQNISSNASYGYGIRGSTSKPITSAS
jgi:predicted Zn-dependent protease